MYRLKTVAPDLARQLTGLAPATQALVARELAHWVLTRPGLQNPAVIEYLSAAVADPALRAAYAELLQAEAQRIDRTAWSIQDTLDAGNAAPDDALAHARAFALARSLSAAAFALHEDAEVAVLETAFEAQAAVHDVAAVRAEVAKLLA